MRRNVAASEKALSESKEKFGEAINALLERLADAAFDEYDTKPINYARLSQEVQKELLAHEDNEVDRAMRKALEAAVRGKIFDANTLEGVAFRMSQVVESRVRSRELLRMILACVDRLAKRLIQDFPADLEDLRGEELVSTIVERLYGEDVLEKFKEGEPAFADMLVRAVAVGWRGSTEDTIDKVYLRAVGERIVALRKHEAIENSFNEELVKLKPSERIEATARFRERLKEEYERLVEQREEMAPDITIDCPTCGAAPGKPCVGLEPNYYHYERRLKGSTTHEEDLTISCVICKARPGEECKGTKPRIVHFERRLAKLMDKPEILERAKALARKDATGMGALLNGPANEVALNSREAEFKNLLNGVVGSKTNVILDDTQHERGSPNPPYDDKLLMRRGVEVWEQTYKLGMTDDETHAFIRTTNKGMFPDDAQFFAALWAVHAFQRITTSHTFAAALMCSDADRGSLESIQRQWRAFMVVVPNGMLVAHKKGSDIFYDFGRLLIGIYEDKARLLLLSTNLNVYDGSSVFVTTFDEAPTLADLLLAPPDELLEEDDQTRRVMIMAKRLVAGLLLSLQHEPNFTTREVEAKPPSKKHREGEPAHRIVNVGRPLTVDCRDAVRRYIEEGKGKRSSSSRGSYSPPTVQVLVRGHYRRQVHGVGRLQRKVIWITPFWRGPEEAIIQTRPLKPE